MHSSALKISYSFGRIVTFLAVAVVSFSACSKKVLPAVPLPPKSIDIQEIDFEYFHGKARLNFRDNTKEREVKAHIRIRKDSVIWMTFTVIGVQGGKAIGATDEIGLRAVESPFAVKDLHATILAALGLRTDNLFFEHNGRPERLTGVAGSSRIIPGVMG